MQLLTRRIFKVHQILAFRDESEYPQVFFFVIKKIIIISVISKNKVKHFIQSRKHWGKLNLKKMCSRNLEMVQDRKTQRRRTAPIPRVENNPNTTSPIQEETLKTTFYTYKKIKRSCLPHSREHREEDCRSSSISSSRRSSSSSSSSSTNIGTSISSKPNKKKGNERY